MKWITIGDSVQGAIHQRKNLPCQDFFSIHCPESASLPVILTAADGHGASKYVRSGVGAKLACETAEKISLQYIRQVFAASPDNTIKEIVSNRFKSDLVKHWQEAVLQHLSLNPLTDEEASLSGLSVDEITACRQGGNLDEFKTKLFSLYGTTLLLVILMDNIIICEQIGDGDILFYYLPSPGMEQGMAITPVEADSSLFANETTSLCSPNAHSLFRHNIIYLYEKSHQPDLIMLTTDGYINSFKSREDYQKAAGDYYELIKTDGVEATQQALKQWLQETSLNGSGDDITLVLAWRDNHEPR